MKIPSIIDSPVGDYELISVLTKYTYIIREEFELALEDTYGLDVIFPVAMFEEGDAITEVSIELYGDELSVPDSHLIELNVHLDENLTGTV